MKHCSNGPHPTAHSTVTLACRVNGRDRALPLSQVHPERFVDLSVSSDLNRRKGGLSATAINVTASLVQIAIRELCDSERAACRAREVAQHLWRVGLAAVATAALPAGAVPGLEVRSYGAHQLLVSFYVEHPGGFGVVEPAARAIAPELARLLDTSVPLAFAIGSAEHRRVRVRGAVGLRALQHDLRAASRHPHSDSRDPQVLSRVLGRLDRVTHTPDLAFELNARVLSGLCAASAIFGAAPDYVRAEGQTHAARWGGCEPLVRWQRAGGELIAELEVPVALQRVRTTVNAAEIETACDVAGVTNTRQLELACASVGLLTSFAGIRSDLRAAQAALPDPHALDRRRAPLPDLEASSAPDAEATLDLLHAVVAATKKQRHHAA